MQAGTDGKPAGEQVLDAVGTFCLIFIGSIIIGAVSALLIAFVLKRQASHAKEQTRMQKK